MSQRRTAPSRLREGGGLGPDRLSLEREITNSIFAHTRQWVACTLATLTMCLVGTVYGWTKTSLVPLTTGSGDVPLTLIRDEYSWSVSFTVLSSVIGSLLATHLADCIGRKYSLLVCSIMFALGWFIMYAETSVLMIYFARGILGISVGIARTINPMFVSEVADINFRGHLSALITANVCTGSLVTHALGRTLTYKSHLLALAIISFIVILLIAFFRETPYFFVAKGQKRQALKSIAFYKGIEDPDRVEIELRALRAEARYGLHQQSRSDLPSPSSSDLPPPYSSNLPSPSSSDLPPPDSSNLALQSIRETHSDPIREVVDTEATTDLNLSSSSDSHSQSRSVTHSEDLCEVLQQATGESRLQPTRDSLELHLLPSCELQSQSTSQIYQPSTSQILPQMRSELHSRSRRDLRTQSNVDSRASMGIRERYMGGTKYTCLNKLRAILQRNNRKALFIMLGLIMAQHLSGNFITTQHLEVLINRKITFISLYKAMILVQLVRLSTGYLTTLIVECCGRRKLLIISTLGSCFTLLMLAGYRFLAEYKSDDSIISLFSVYFLMWHQILFQIGLGTLPNVLLCDLFPTKLKGYVGAIVVTFDGIIGLIAPKLYQVTADNEASYKIYITFATSCFLAFLLVLIWLPETKRKTYHEIEALLVGENLNSSNEEVSSDEMDIHRI